MKKSLRPSRYLLTNGRFFGVTLVDTKFFMNTTLTYCETHATRSLPSRRGFTFLELVIVWGIIGRIIGGDIGVMGEVGDGGDI